VGKVYFQLEFDSNCFVTKKPDIGTCNLHTYFPWLLPYKEERTSNSENQIDLYLVVL